MRITLSMLCMLTGLAISATGASARNGGGPAGGQTAPHMSNEGIANTNGPMSADRDKGLSRAEDRESAQGLAHEKATKHPHRPRHKQQN